MAVPGLMGGVLGAAIGAALALRAMQWRPAIALFLVFALLGGIGWVVGAARETIDCDDRPSFCDERYGD